MADWEHFPHGADMGVRGTGRTMEEAFEQAAKALTAVVVDPENLSTSEVVRLSCAAPDDELLLVDWLNNLVYEMAIRKCLFGRFSVQIRDHTLVGTAWGEAIDPDKHELAVEVKGATCTELKVGRNKHGDWLAQCVVDV